jgi:hypothetical protein
MKRDFSKRRIRRSRTEALKHRTLPRAECTLIECSAHRGQQGLQVP